MERGRCAGAGEGKSREPGPEFDLGHGKVECAGAWSGRVEAGAGGCHGRGGGGRGGGLNGGWYRVESM